MPPVGLSGLLSSFEGDKVRLVGTGVLIVVQHSATGNMDQINLLNQL